MSRDDSKHTLLHTRFVTLLKQPQRGSCEHDAKQISDSRESILHRMHEPVEDREDCSFCRPASLLSRKIVDVVFDRLDLCLDSKGVKFRKK